MRRTILGLTLSAAVACRPAEGRSAEAAVWGWREGEWKLLLGHDR